jgi:hypothetical protein
MLYTLVDLLDRVGLSAPVAGEHDIPPGGSWQSSARGLAVLGR